MRYILKLFIIFLPWFYSHPLSASDKKTLNFGVFSFLGEDATRDKFEPIVDYLNQQLQDEYLKLHVLPHEQLLDSIRLGKIDIVATNPTHFLLARQQFNVSGAIATLVESHQGEPVYQLGGAIITLSERTDLNRISDLKNRRIGIPSKFNMGGYRTQAYELHQAGINLTKGVSFIELGTHQAVVDAVISKQIDAGFIRDGVLESLIQQHSIPADLIKVLQPQPHPNFKHQVSTRLYPEWPIFALQHVEERAVRHLASALFSLEPEHPAAQKAGIYGFTIPADYFTVEELARALRLPPFDQAPDFTFADTWQRWSNIYWLLLGGVLASILFTFFVIAALKREKAEHARFERLLSTLGEGVYGADRDGKCIFINPAALQMLGLTEKKQVLGKNQHDMFHHHYPNGKVYPQDECPIQKTTEDGQVRRSEEWFFRADGEGFPVSLVVTPLYEKNKISGSVIAFQDITELKNLQKQLENQARFDSLTGLPNRGYLLENIQNEFNRIKRHHTKAILIMADLDKFKSINDQYGHAIGDQVLKDFAHLMSNNLRKTDIFGRFGGEEFVILLTETDLYHGKILAERLRHNVSEHVVKVDQLQIKFTVSLGMVELNAKSENIETALTYADKALYQAKNAGRNRIEIYKSNL
ncbi:diguanylate cyclase [Thiomicrospira microaerophila]|uniref:diguanylate cyclase n=1 Tax=Thiomicrospira microaerophila TaxID=406020 RepID=UPI00200C054C|nr:diguanylate cyclase [Thiomicrospira microaerophila]UQB41294.1 diguanylate cyclase [Thiomicrospira microaerophila]